MVELCNDLMTCGEQGASLSFHVKVSMTIMATQHCYMTITSQRWATDRPVLLQNLGDI